MSKRAFAAYVDGLREVGWRGDERVERFAYAASSALYLAPVVPFWLARLADPVRREWVEQKCGRRAEDVVRAWVVLLNHALKRAEEAYAIVDR